MVDKVDIYAKKPYRIRATDKLHARVGPHIVLEIERNVRKVFIAPGQVRRVPDPEKPGETKVVPVDPVVEHVHEISLVTASQLAADGYAVTPASAQELPTPVELASSTDAVSPAEAAIKVKKGAA